MRDRISPEGYSVADDEKMYLRQLYDMPNDTHEIADALAADPPVSKAHRPTTVDDRLAYLADYGGTEHLLERDEDRYWLTEDGKPIFC